MSFDAVFNIVCAKVGLGKAQYEHNAAGNGRLAERSVAGVLNG